MDTKSHRICCSSPDRYPLLCLRTSQKSLSLVKILSVFRQFSLYQPPWSVEFRKRNQSGHRHKRCYYCLLTTANSAFHGFSLPQLPIEYHGHHQSSRLCQVLHLRKSVHHWKVRYNALGRFLSTIFRYKLLTVYSFSQYFLPDGT